MCRIRDNFPCGTQHILKTAKIRYSNPYQTRQTYASQLLANSENSLFVTQQMGHKTTEMIMRHSGHWVEQADQRQRHVFVSDFGQGVKELRPPYPHDGNYASAA